MMLLKFNNTLDSSWASIAIFCSEMASAEVIHILLKGSLREYILREEVIVYFNKRQGFNIRFLIMMDNINSLYDLTDELSKFLLQQQPYLNYEMSERQLFANFPINTIRYGTFIFKDVVDTRYLDFHIQISTWLLKQFENQVTVNETLILIFYFRKLTRLSEEGFLRNNSDQYITELMDNTFKQLSEQEKRVIENNFTYNKESFASLIKNELELPNIYLKSINDLDSIDKILNNFLPITAHHLGLTNSKAKIYNVLWARTKQYLRSILY